MAPWGPSLRFMIFFCVVVGCMLTGTPPGPTKDHQLDTRGNSFRNEGMDTPTQQNTSSTSSIAYFLLLNTSPDQITPEQDLPSPPPTFTSDNSRRNISGLSASKILTHPSVSRQKAPSQYGEITHNEISTIPGRQLNSATHSTSNAYQHKPNGACSSHVANLLLLNGFRQRDCTMSGHRVLRTYIKINSKHFTLGDNLPEINLTKTDTTQQHPQHNTNAQSRSRPRLPSLPSTDSPFHHQPPANKCKANDKVQLSLSAKLYHTCSSHTPQRPSCNHVQLVNSPTAPAKQNTFFEKPKIPSALNTRNTPNHIPGSSQPPCSHETTRIIITLDTWTTRITPLHEDHGKHRYCRTFITESYHTSFPNWTNINKQHNNNNIPTTTSPHTLAAKGQLFCSHRLRHTLQSLPCLHSHLSRLPLPPLQQGTRPFPLHRSRERHLPRSRAAYSGNPSHPRRVSIETPPTTRFDSQRLGHYLAHNILQLLAAHTRRACRTRQNGSNQLQRLHETHPSARNLVSHHRTNCETWQMERRNPRVSHFRTRRPTLHRFPLLPTSSYLLPSVNTLYEFLLFGPHPIIYLIHLNTVLS